MTDKKRIFLGMSGGVDSSTAAILLIEEGFDVTGVTHVVRDGGESDASEAKALCDALGIPHVTLDLKNEFRQEVINYFISEYECGNTPNPCVKCNEKIKFPYLFSQAKNGGFTATGHYAKIGKVGDRFFIKRAKDRKKDQSYVLWSLKEQNLSGLYFPLGDLTKEEVREIALEKGFSSASKKESQDICFIPDGDYVSFIEKTTLKKTEKGRYISPDGRYLGLHEGHIRYTPGQSRGLGIALGKKVYVISKNASDNTVVLGDKSDVMQKVVKAHRINLFAADSIPDSSRFTVKIRYGKNDTPATVTQTGEDEVTAVFDEPVSAPAKGQSMVIYDGDAVVGGGVII